jgi:hypothetical protein
MKRIEIKLNKGVHLALISLFIFGIMFAIWGITIPDVELYIKVSFAIAIPFWLYYAYKLIARINEPVIILTKNSIQILDENKHCIFLWTDIIDTEVNYKKTGDDVEYSLTLGTKTESRTFKINGINKTADELRQLINDVKM